MPGRDTPQCQCLFRNDVWHLFGEEEVCLLELSYATRARQRTVKPFCRLDWEDRIFQSPDYARWSLPLAQVFANCHKLVRPQRNRVLVELRPPERCLDERPEVGFDCLIGEIFRIAVRLSSHSLGGSRKLFVVQMRSDEPIGEGVILCKRNEGKELRRRFVLVHVTVR